jgi:hypothetical protein
MTNKDSSTESQKTVVWNIRSHGLFKTVLEIDHGDAEPVTIKTSLFKMPLNLNGMVTVTAWRVHPCLKAATFLTTVTRL